MKPTINLSYFDRRLGPTLFYSYPEAILDEDLSHRLGAIMEAVFTCTREEGIPLLMEARSNKLAVINDMTMASIGPKRKIPFPVCFNNL